jgi:uncharacterized protein
MATMWLMDGSRTRVDVLSREECLRRLEFKSYVGRVGFLSDDQLYVLPVNYLAENEAIFFCTAEGTKLSALSGGNSVTFEVDASQPLYHSGWSVMVTGTAHEVTDPDELERLRRGPLRSWAVQSSQHWVRISIDSISGRQIPES